MHNCQWLAGIMTVLIYLAVWIMPVARGGDNAAEELFKKVALKQRRSLADLEKQRGLRKLITGEDGVTCSSVAEVLKPSSEPEYLRRSSEGGYWPSTSVLVYAYEEGKLHSWLIGDNGLLAFFSTPVTQKVLEQKIQEQRVALGVGRLQKSRIPYQRGMVLSDQPTRRTVEEATRDLSKLLIAPPIAEGLKKTRHLIIVPVFSLSVVPFATLQPFGNKDALIDHMTISVAPSLFDIDQFLNETFPPPEIEKVKWIFETPLIVGLTEFPREGKYHFSPLPAVKKELEAVTKELNVRPLLNSQATKRAVQAKAAGADLIYIASHGFSDEKEGYLVLWPDEKSDGIWSGQEIHDLKFKKAYVAILSACQTGLGRIHDAGMIGVARSFQMGGVPRVVVSLWSVKDEETAIFMAKLVRNMRKTMVAQALRETALEMRRDFPDPVVWASFTLFGTPR